MERLSQKHKLFVEAYDGNLIEAMRVAGYEGSDMYLKQKGELLMEEPLIIEAIKERSKYIASLKNAIATREERQLLWTQIMKNEDPYRKEELDPNGVPIPEGNIPIPIRLKASELLGKSEADFVDKVDVTQTLTLSDIILKSYDKESTKSIEDIEAEYYKMQEDKELPAPENLDDLI
jgi:hypothetical protein